MIGHYYYFFEEDFIIESLQEEMNQELLSRKITQVRKKTIHQKRTVNGFHFWSFDFKKIFAIWLDFECWPLLQKKKLWEKDNEGHHFCCNQITLIWYFVCILSPKMIALKKATQPIWKWEKLVRVLNSSINFINAATTQQQQQQQQGRCCFQTPPSVPLILLFSSLQS